MRQGVLVKVGRREFWANLEWETIPLGADRKERLREIRATVGNGGLYCQQVVSSHDHVSIGYGAPPSGHRRTVSRPSLAAAVANAEKDPWIGTFCLSAEQDLWWMVAVTEGHSIIVGGDVVGTKAEVEAARDEIKGYEKDWRFFEGDESALQEFLAEGRREAGRAIPMVKPFVWRPAVWQVAAVAMVVAGGVAWHVIAQREQAAALAAALRAAQLQRYAQEHKMSLEAAMAARARPWRSVTRPGPFLQQCGHVLNEVPIDLYGWTPVTLACSLTHDEMRAVLTWHRSSSGTALTTPHGTLSPHGNTLVDGPAHWRLPLPAQVRSVGPGAAIRRTLLAWSQTAPVTLTFAPSARHKAAPKLPGVARRPAGPAPLKSLYAHNSATVKTTLPAALLPLERIPGMRIASLTIAHPEGQAVWTAHLTWWSLASAVHPAAAPSSPAGPRWKPLHGAF